MWQVTSTLGNHAARFPIRESEAVQLSRGPSSVQSLVVMGENLFAYEISTVPDTIWTIVPEPDWVGLLMPLSMKNEYRVDGWSITPRDVVLLDGRSDYTTSGAQRRSFFIGIRREVLVRFCASLTATEVSELGSGHSLIELRDKPNNLHLLIRRAFEAALELGPKQGLLTLPQLHERDLISAIADWLTGRTATAKLVRMKREDPFRIVEAARELVRNSDSDQISMADLCAVAGVGKTRLHQCFVDITGISPGQYLIHHRLSVARELLLNEGTRPALVKQVSLQLGFSNSGRFAKRYFEVFGEFPHENIEERVTRRRA